MIMLNINKAGQNWGNFLTLFTTIPCSPPHQNANTWLPGLMANQGMFTNSSKLMMSYHICVCMSFKQA